MKEILKIILRNIIGWIIFVITVFWSIAVYWAWNDIVNDWDQLTANSWNEMIAQIWQNIADIVTNKNDITAVNTSISGINTNVSNLSNTVNNITDNFATDWSLTLQNWWTVNNISSDSTLSAWSSAIPTVDAVKSYIDNNVTIPQWWIIIKYEWFPNTSGYTWMCNWNPCQTIFQKSLSNNRVPWILAQWPDWSWISNNSSNYEITSKEFLEENVNKIENIFEYNSLVNWQVNFTFRVQNWAIQQNKRTTLKVYENWVLINTRQFDNSSASVSLGRNNTTTSMRSSLINIKFWKKYTAELILDPGYFTSRRGNRNSNTNRFFSRRWYSLNWTSSRYHNSRKWLFILKSIQIVWAVKKVYAIDATWAGTLLN